jgi:N-acetylglucosamine kinase-like BadF-type ATPase
MRSLLLGVDGGNTKTVALVADAGGHIIGFARSGCSDIYGAGPEAGLAELDQAVNGALQRANARPEDVLVAAFSLAGADWPEDFAFLRSQITHRLHRLQALILVNDAIGALRAGTADGVGVSVVCGTGSAIGAKSADGKAWHASFWGEDLGAVTIGQRAIRSIIRSELGLQPPTGLTARALDALGAMSVQELLHAVTRRGAQPSRFLAGLAQHVLDAAEDDDTMARRIVEDMGVALGSYAGAAARQVGLSDGPFTLVLAGGVFRHPSTTLRAAILSAVPMAHPTQAELEPAVGALLLAFDETGQRVDSAVIQSTLPSIGLFTGHAPGLAGTLQQALPMPGGHGG